MQNTEKGIENLLINMMLEKKNFKKTQIQIDEFSCLIIWNGLNIF
jgi:hypothetical protein